MVGEEAVDGDYVERLLHFRPRVVRSATARGLRTLPEIHSLSCSALYRSSVSAFKCRFSVSIFFSASLVLWV